MYCKSVTVKIRRDMWTETLKLIVSSKLYIIKKQKSIPMLISQKWLSQNSPVIFK